MPCDSIASICLVTAAEIDGSSDQAELEPRLVLLICKQRRPGAENAPRAIDPYLGFYPESELDPSSELQPTRRVLDETSIDVDTSRGRIAPPVPTASSSQIHRTTSSQDDSDSGPAPSRHNLTARKRQRVDSEDFAGSNSDAQLDADDFWDMLPAPSAAAVANPAAASQTAQASEQASSFDQRQRQGAGSARY